jgi:uncharacterized Zn finger protein
MNYARQGQVIDFHLSAGRVTARVQGTRPEPYDVIIRIDLITDGEWQTVVEKMAAQAAFSAKLLSGEMPWNIEDAFAEAGVNLLPMTARDLKTSCSCPDSANPCKHIAAVYYILAEEFDREPFMIFTLRGRTREAITRQLRIARSHEALDQESIDKIESTGVCAKPLLPDMFLQGEEAPREEALSFYPDHGGEDERRLGERLDDFYACGNELDSFNVHILPPRIRGGLLKRLGAPSFWDSDMDFTEEMGKLYALISNSAMENAMGKPENS